MYIDTVIDLATDIVAELERVRDTFEENVMNEDDCLSNLEEVYDSLKCVNESVRGI